jgi:hypothetical protein
MTKVVINTCFGGFNLSDEAYEWLIANGVKVGKYHEEPRNPKTGLYDIKPPENEGEIIFDRTLTPEGTDKITDLMRNPPIGQRYWESFIDRGNRDWPLLIQCVEALGDKAGGCSAQLKVIEIPDDVEYEIDEYDGNENIAEKHRVWS